MVHIEFGRTLQLGSKVLFDNEGRELCRNRKNPDILSKRAERRKIFRLLCEQMDFVQAIQRSELVN